MPSRERAENGIPLVKGKHLIPYLFIFIATPAIMYFSGNWLDASLGFPQFPPLPWNLVSGFIVFFAGLYIGIKSTRVLYLRGKGLPWGGIEEQTRSSRLVTSGPYAYTRNPITLGYSMLPLGMGLMFRSPSMAFIFPVIVLAVEVPLLKLREEPSLERRFGASYLDYRIRTPFLLPDVRKLLEARLHFMAGEPDRKNLRSSVLEFGYIGTSLIGLLLLVLLTFSSGAWKATHPFQKGISLSVFLIICLGGIFAALYPSQITRTTHFRVSEHDLPQDLENNFGPLKELVGHHPQCEAFVSHVLHVSGKGYCAGCTGLATGAFLAIVGIVLYAFLQPSSSIAEAMFWVGVLFVSVGLLQYRLGIVWPAVHFAVNVVFVVGPSFLLVGVTELTGNLVVQAYLLSITLFWILARISLSGLEHDRICSACQENTCPYAFSRRD